MPLKGKGYGGKYPFVSYFEQGFGLSVILTGSFTNVVRGSMTVSSPCLLQTNFVWSWDRTVSPSPWRQFLTSITRLRNKGELAFVA